MMRKSLRMTETAGKPCCPRGSSQDLMMLMMMKKRTSYKIAPLHLAYCVEWGVVGQLPYYFGNFATNPFVVLLDSSPDKIKPLCSSGWFGTPLSPTPDFIMHTNVVLAIYSAKWVESWVNRGRGELSTPIPVDTQVTSDLSHLEVDKLTRHGLSPAW